MQYFILDSILKTLKLMATCMRFLELTVRFAKKVAENMITGII